MISLQVLTCYILINPSHLVDRSRTLIMTTLRVHRPCCPSRDVPCCGKTTCDWRRAQWYNYGVVVGENRRTSLCMYGNGDGMVIFPSTQTRECYVFVSQHVNAAMTISKMTPVSPIASQRSKTWVISVIEILHKLY